MMSEAEAEQFLFNVELRALQPNASPEFWRGAKEAIRRLLQVNADEPYELHFTEAS